jgi:tricorn protease
MYPSLRLTGLTLLLCFSSFALDTRDTRFLTQPAVSQSQVAFLYANDLWIAGIDGSNPRRLTADHGVESNPVFSPDGRTIAFSAQYEGNTDVYVVPAEGGVPKRLTWHPGVDLVQSFTPDGRSILFTTPRAVFTSRHTQFFTVAMDGSAPEQPLGLPTGDRGAYSPDGKLFAYNPGRQVFGQWKHYRGGTVSVLWIYRFSDRGIEKVPQPAGRCNDVDPMWIGGQLYFRSDRAGEFNLHVYDPASKKVKQLTQHTDFPVATAAAGGGRIVYEQAATLHIFDPGKAKSSRLPVGIAADLLETRPRFVKGFKWIRSSSLSPSGSRVALEFRGEIVTIPGEKGDPRYLTATPGTHERSPVWSPDGAQIAWLSDVSGEYELHVAQQDAKGEVRKYKLGGAGFYETPAWSPDGKKLAFVDNSWSLFWIDLASGSVKKIASEPLYGPQRARTIAFAWSPDSKWLAYTLNNKSYIQSLFAYSTEQDKSHQITDGLSDAAEPVFDASGKYLYFLASTDSGPVRHWFDMSNADKRPTSSIYLAVLRRDLPSPLAKESDEEKAAAKDTKESKPEPAAKDSFSIDFDGIQNRILALPVPRGEFTSLAAGAAGILYYQEAMPSADGSDGPPFGPPLSRDILHRYDLNKRKGEPWVNGIVSFQVSGDTKKLLYATRDAMHIVSATDKPAAAAGKLNTDAIEVRVDPRAEWAQMFHEVWRINRDYFYDPGMHGADWKAAREKYGEFLPHLAARSDLNRLIQWMCSELAVGHHRVAGGDTAFPPKTVPGGLLGADYSIENGRYRFKKVYGGLNWNPGLRSPLTEPGVDVRAGEYLLAVQGADLRPPANLYSFFENTSGKLIEITVGPNPDGSNSRTVKVVPVAEELTLRNRDWVEGNLRKVDQATGGRVAYVYVPNTTTLGHTYFRRYFYPQAHKDAIIVDERFNGGGQIADYYIEHLRRPFISYWATRYGEDLKTPTASIQGPKVMLIDESAGSGGDLLPWMFRKFQLGKLVGTRTWGGLVGILGFPVLMDGASITAPNLAIWTPEGGFVVENEGVPPDIEVEQTPSAVMDGRDPQLEKAIEVVMEELKKNPPRRPVRPPFPKRALPATSVSRASTQ